MKYILVTILAIAVPILGRPQQPAAPAVTPAAVPAAAPAAVPAAASAAAQSHPPPPPPPSPAQPHLEPHPHPHPPPPPPPSQPQGSDVTPIPIVSQTEVVGPDGSFNYSYETGNGIHVEQGGFIRKAPEGKALNASNPDETGDIQVIEGSYSYTAPDGQSIVLKYIADENGFQPEGNHIPTAPPVPEGIASALEQEKTASPQLHPEAQAQAHPQPPAQPQPQAQAQPQPSTPAPTP